MHCRRTSIFLEITDPVQEYFQRECGLVVIIPPKFVSDRSPLQQEFRKQGGLIVPFYCSKEVYKEHIADVKMIYGLRLPVNRSVILHYLEAI